MSMMTRGIRGATTSTANTREAILEATTEMLERLVEANDLGKERIAAALSPSMEPKLPCPSTSGARMAKSCAMRTSAS